MTNWDSKVREAIEQIDSIAVAGEDEPESLLRRISEISHELLDQLLPLRESEVRLIEAAIHLRAVARRGGSEFIKENGRLGKSPWVEFCDAADVVGFAARPPGPKEEPHG